MWQEIDKEKLEELQDSALYLLRKQWTDEREEREPELMIDPTSNDTVQV